MNSAIIVAAGSGTRFGSEIPKQFLEINGKPMVSHSITAFENAVEIGEIVLVVSEADMDRAEMLRSDLNSKKLASIVAGGKTRAESVRNGFLALGKGGVVAVHDAARPLVLPIEIDKVVMRARQVGAACLTLPVTDTIKEVAGDLIKRTVDRKHLRRAATPQAFTYEILEKALDSENLDPSATDECFLVEKLGYEIAFIDGSTQNIKITYPEDLQLAEAILRSRN
jgi:2-C-methyl-D-erythritol 4-phosphate cytidylyltransferase